MMRITLALDRYDRHFPFFDGSISLPAPFQLEAMQVGQSTKLRHGTKRHERMMKAEFDVAEFSMSTYLMARARNLPIIAIPVFPRRLFSQSQMWVRPDANLWHPRDLVGKKVALGAFQTTVSLLAKGDMRFYYDVPWKKIHWLLTEQEKVKFATPEGARIDFIGGRDLLGHKLQSGEIDAFIVPHPPHSVASGETPARRLFADPQAEESEYYRKVGDFPIMHVIAIRTEVLDKAPDLAMHLMKAFEDARHLVADYYEDPNWSRLAWGRHLFEKEAAVFGRDPWENGFARNKANVERFIRYSHDQGLIPEAYPAETLFAKATLAT